MNEGLNVLSLYDGMSGGQIALKISGIPVKRYVAYEIDKYAIQTTLHNFPETEECGDVTTADFVQYEGFDLLCGGSPCTYWSIAQSPDKRETTASGVGWELFSHYVRALHEAKPKYFIYENNKSMSNAIRQSISEAFGFEPICINSALVSAQNRQRLYWVGIRQSDGTYRRADIEQPEDRGILLKDILTSGEIDKNKAYCLKHQAGNVRDYFKKHHTQIALEPVNTTKEGKSQTIKSQYQNTNEQNICCYKSTYGATGVALSVKYPLESVTDNETGVIGKLEMPKGNHDLVKRVYSPNGKSSTLNSCGGGNREPKTFSETNTPFSGKNIYEVKDGQITIKNKQYPIKLKDGHYIIRKLTVDECKRLQTVPDWFEFPVSKSQSYKMLGNGWTIEVIVHLIKGLKIFS